MKRTVLPIWVFVLLGLTSFHAFADRKIFGYTYPYQTLPQGTLELEHYLDMGINDWDDPSTLEIEKEWTSIDWKHQIEFEYGITDRLDIGFYNVFSQKPFSPLQFDGWKFRSRYRFLEKGSSWIDPAVYIEAGYFGDEILLEEMLILSKTIGSFEIAFNAKVEQEYLPGSGEWEFEFIPLLGIGYHFNPVFALSLEYYGKIKVENGEVEYFVNYLGLAIGLAGTSFYWTLAVLPQLGNRDGSASVMIRSLFGVYL